MGMAESGKPKIEKLQRQKSIVQSQPRSHSNPPSDYDRVICFFQERVGHSKGKRDENEMN